MPHLVPTIEFQARPLVWGPNLIVQADPDPQAWVVSVLVGWHVQAPDPVFSLDGDWAGLPQVMAEHGGLRWGRVTFRLTRHAEGRWVRYRWAFPGLNRGDQEPMPGLMGMGQAAFHVPAAGVAPRLACGVVPAENAEAKTWAQDIMLHGQWQEMPGALADGPTLATSAVGPLDALLLEGRMVDPAADVWDDPVLQAWCRKPLNETCPDGKAVITGGLEQRIWGLCFEAYTHQLKAPWQAEFEEVTDDADPDAPDLVPAAAHLGARIPAIWAQAALPLDPPVQSKWLPPVPVDDPRHAPLCQALAHADRAARRVFTAHMIPEPRFRLADPHVSLERQWGLTRWHDWGQAACWVLDGEAQALASAPLTLHEVVRGARAVSQSVAHVLRTDADGMPPTRDGEMVRMATQALEASLRAETMVVRPLRPLTDRPAPELLWCLDEAGILESSRWTSGQEGRGRVDVPALPTQWIGLPRRGRDGTGHLPLASGLPLDLVAPGVNACRLPWPMLDGEAADDASMAWWLRCDGAAVRREWPHAAGTRGAASGPASGGPLAGSGLGGRWWWRWRATPAQDAPGWQLAREGQ